MMLRRRYLVVGLLGVVSVITFLDRMAIAVVGPLVQRDLHLTPERWSWVLSAYVIAYGLFEIPSGALEIRTASDWSSPGSPLGGPHSPP
jgi:ACS family glucarate transporter-like MFS transporter